MHKVRFILDLLICFFVLIMPLAAVAQEGPSAEELARKAQDPLGDVRAIMTDNTIAFGTADDETSYNFQIQPVYSIPTDRGFNFIARAIIPIVGAPSEAGLPRLGPDQTPDKGTKWGLSDTILQLFWTPKTDAAIKFGIGPQVSIPTHTTDRVAGPQWGAGLAGVFFGFAGELAYGAILGHHWGEHDFSVTTIQPVLYYNIAALPGSYVGYNNSITYNWNANSGDRWQVPLGLTVGRTLPVGKRGDALDLNLGGYGLAERPKGGADWQLKFGISWFFP